MLLRRLVPALALVVVAAAVAVSASRRSAPRVPSASRPVLWVDHDGGACRRRRTYDDAAACGSLDTAYRTARPGEQVLVVGGTYPPQRIGVDPSKVNAREDVVVEPARGADVRIAGDLTVAGSHVRIRARRGSSAFRVRYAISEATAPAATSSRHVTFERFDGAGFVIGPVEDVTIRGGDWGPNLLRCGDDGGGQESKITPLDTFPGRVPRHVVLDGLRIHDQNSADLSCQHMGGLSVVSADGLTIRNTRWTRSAVYDLAVGDFTGRFGNPRDVVIENNWFGAAVLQDGRTPDRQPELQLAEPGPYERWTVRFNSFVTGPALNFDGGARFSDVRVVANVGAASGCRAALRGVVWAANVWTDAACGSGDRVVPALPYVSARAGAEDLHLRRGAPVSVHLPPGAAAPARDIDGQLRPRGGVLDAGSDQR